MSKVIYVLRSGCFAGGVELEVGRQEVSDKVAKYMLKNKYAEPYVKKPFEKSGGADSKLVKENEGLKAELEALKVELSKAIKPEKLVKENEEEPKIKDK